MPTKTSRKTPAEKPANAAGGKPNQLQRPLGAPAGPAHRESVV